MIVFMLATWYNTGPIYVDVSSLEKCHAYFAWAGRMKETGKWRFVTEASSLDRFRSECYRVGYYGSGEPGDVR